MRMLLYKYIQSVAIPPHIYIKEIVMLLIDEVVTNYESAGNSLHYMLNAEFDSASKKYVYRQGDYIIAFNSDDIKSECETIAISEEGLVVSTTYRDLMSGEETKEHKLLSDKEIVSRLRYIESDTSVSDGDLWEDHVRDPYDWDFVRFILKHRPDLMI